jgi:hypothetical protein
VRSASRDVEDSVSDAPYRELIALDALGRLSAEYEDLDEVLRLALDRMTEITGLEIAYISLPDEETGQLEVVAHTEWGEDLSCEANGKGLARDLAERVARAAEVLVIDDTWLEPEFSGEATTKPRVRSFAGIPLKSREVVLGVVSVASPRPFRFSSGQLSFLSVLAGQLSWAMESTVLRERLDSFRFRLRERVKELSILYDVSREALVARDIGSFLGFVARRLPAIQHTLVETLKTVEAGALFLLDTATAMLRVASSFGYDADALRAVNLRVGKSMSGMVFESGTPDVWSTPANCASAMSSMTAHNRELVKQAAHGFEFPRSTIGVPHTSLCPTRALNCR